MSHTKKGKPGRKPIYASEEEKQIAKQEYNRLYHINRYVPVTNKRKPGPKPKAIRCPTPEPLTETDSD